MATLTISASHDYSGDVLFNIGTFDFINGAGTTATAIFDGGQFNNLNVRKTVAVDGSAGTNIVEVDVGIGGFNASAWTFTHWTGADRLLLMGSAYGESLTGSTARDTILGAGGRDTIRGLAGADTIAGGIGADRMYGGSGQDTLSYEDSSSAVRVNLGTGTAFGGDASGDVFKGFERLTGSSFDDELTGSSASNRLTGGLGADELRGGAGADQFVYTSIADSQVGAGHDLIRDFSQAEGDRIRLSPIDAIVTGDGGGNDAFTYIGEGPFSAPGQVRSFVQGGNTYVQANVDGNLAPDFEIKLAGIYALSAGDFIL